jgi:hypothetical protein
VSTAKRPYHRARGSRNDAPGTWEFYEDTLVFLPDDPAGKVVVTTDRRIIDAMARRLDAPPEPGAECAPGGGPTR